MNQERLAKSSGSHFMTLCNVHVQIIPGGKCLWTAFTLISKRPWEVYVFYMVPQVTLESYQSCGWVLWVSVGVRALTSEICKLSFIGCKTSGIVWLSGVQNSVRGFTSNNIANCLADQHVDTVGTEGAGVRSLPRKPPGRWTHFVSNCADSGCSLKSTFK